MRCAGIIGLFPASGSATAEGRKGHQGAVRQQSQGFRLLSGLFPASRTGSAPSR